MSVINKWLWTFQFGEGDHACKVLKPVTFLYKNLFHFY